jgi:hypothetical protein
VSFEPGDRVCAVCARVLDRVERAGVTVGWRHTLIDTPADHPAVPVRPEQVHTASRCDFCSADAPSWAIPARPFVYEGAPDAGSDGDWAGCDACAELIRRNRWTALRQRAVAAFAARTGAPADQLEPLGRALGRLYRQLRRNMLGPPQPL